jgi:hypothetical protein
MVVLLIILKYVERSGCTLAELYYHAFKLGVHISPSNRLVTVQESWFCSEIVGLEGIRTNTKIALWGWPVSGLHVFWTQTESVAATPKMLLLFVIQSLLHSNLLLRLEIYPRLSHQAQNNFVLRLQVWRFISEPSLGWLQRKKALFLQEDWMKRYHKIPRITAPKTYCTLSGVPWLMITGTGLDDWIVLTLLVQLHLITITYKSSQSLIA